MKSFGDWIDGVNSGFTQSLIRFTHFAVGFMTKRQQLCIFRVLQDYEFLAKSLSSTAKYYK